MTDAPPSLAVQRRRASQRQEWAEQTRLAEMLDEYLDPADMDVAGEQATFPAERHLSKAARRTERPPGCGGHLARKANLRRAEIAGRRGEQSAEANSSEA
jgi:hypothetical protein